MHMLTDVSFSGLYSDVTTRTASLNSGISFLGIIDNGIIDPKMNSIVVGQILHHDSRKSKDI